MKRGLGETVLVVDDEPNVRMLVAEVLSEKSYQYPGRRATDLQRARSSKSDRRIDLMITDVGLPGGINGRQIAERAGFWARSSRYCSSPDTRKTPPSQNHLEPGMAVLTKPFAMSTLANKIREMLKIQRCARLLPRISPCLNRPFWEGDPRGGVARRVSVRESSCAGPTSITGDRLHVHGGLPPQIVFRRQGGDNWDAMSWGKLGHRVNRYRF